MTTQLVPAKSEPQNSTALDSYELFKLSKEETIQGFYDGDRRLATITRNYYGALVLNTDRVMFVDVDLAPRLDGADERPGMNDLLAKANQSPTLQRLRRKSLLCRFSAVAQAHPELGMRVYRTAAGYRLLLTDREYEALDPETENLFSGLSADPIYARLCRSQQCFRARVSPKPWRVGMDVRPSRKPKTLAISLRDAGRWLRRLQLRDKPWKATDSGLSQSDC